MDNVVEEFHMSYTKLNESTGGFSDNCLLGSGTFGKVYKGNIEGTEIAVKLLHSTDVDGNAFAREFNNLTKLKHPNIVQLVGFCNEEENVVTEYNGKNIIATVMHRALCLEYLHNGSLRNHLSDEQQGLDWQKRYKIIKGVCMGLKYLHMELESPFYHLDLKPDNILLDSNMEPKIADFGLSRLLGEETSSKKTQSTVGTLGYCPPEFINNQTISKEFDIFSLGVIIIKVICGPEVHSPADGMKHTKFIRQVLKKWRERLRAIPGYTSLEADSQQVKKCIEIALMCTNKDRQRRPSIACIVDQLDETEKYNNDKAYSIDKFSPFGMPLPKDLPAAFMKEITNDFAPERELGHSAFGVFYKGILPEGGLIAVKRLTENVPVAPGKIFDTEVRNLMALQHENILELVGFCHEVQKEVIPHNGRYVIVDVIESCLCYKYPPKGSLYKHLHADARPSNWDTRFKIIKGISQGLHFLHKELDGTLIHMNLVPNSIWLDENWVPKIAEFGLSRVFGQEQNRIFTGVIKGHNGYIAPEYLYLGEISTMLDIYSLGMIILEITTGEMNHSVSEDKSARNFVHNVHQNWKTNEQIICKYPSLDINSLQQVKVCLMIGLRCVEPDRNRRPSIVDIIDKLHGKRALIFEEINEGVTITTPLSNALLDVYPAQLRIPFKPDKLSSCPLRLTNVTDGYVAARLLTKNKRRYNSEMPLYAVVPPKSTYTLVVTMREQKNQPPLDSDECLWLESRMVREDVSLENAYIDSAAIASSNFFTESKELVIDKVHKMMLNIGFYSPEEATSDRPFRCEIEIISNKKFSQVMSVDLHPSESWILTSHHGGDIFIWDYKELEIESAFDFTQRPVYSAKFIEREHWFIAGDGDGIIYVYNYDTDEEVISIEAHEGDITSLAVHPSDPLVISSSDDYLIKLWNWEKGWECARIFEGHSGRVTQLNFNPTDPKSFASASMDCTVKIWNISSSESEITLSEHADRLLCVQIYTSGIRQYLFTGSCDGTAHIWNLETETCVETLKGHMNLISSVYHHPELPVLITGSHDGTVRLWDRDTYRLEKIIGVNLGSVYAFGYIKGSRR